MIPEEHIEHLGPLDEASSLEPADDQEDEQVDSSVSPQEQAANDAPEVYASIGAHVVEQDTRGNASSAVPEEAQFEHDAREHASPPSGRNDLLFSSLNMDASLKSGPTTSGPVPQTQNMSVGVRFRSSGQVFFLPAPEQTVRIGTKVLVKLEQGPALGEVVSMLDPALGKLPKEEFAGKITGLATAQDIALDSENRILTAEASAFCKTCIRQRELDMKLVDVEVLHDRSKIIFFFTAPSRIDFRELVKDLVRNYRTRIELRQIGVRHETQMIGGIGNCGSVCCCHRFLRKFAPVTIKMAKEQNLFLNPAKLSGMCGRLLCCLSYEQSNYDEFNRRSPKIGKRYQTTEGLYKVLRTSMFSQSIVCLSPANEEAEFSLEEWEKLQPRRSEQISRQSAEADASDESSPNWGQEDELAAIASDDIAAFPAGNRERHSERADRKGTPSSPPSQHAAGRGKKSAAPGRSGKQLAQEGGRRTRL